ncbi:NYN domain-containing protein [Candidatus Falkowbacteria bacterium]|nr:NYN domain-containing protein [Candidatus Falkowbacteria bacterium]
MTKHPEQRVGVFIDVQNLYYSAKNLFHAKVDFGKVLKEAVGPRKLIRAFAYVIQAQLPEEKKFFTALDSQGFEVKMKDLQVFVTGDKKGDWDVGMTIDAIKVAPQLDVIVLVTGDGDYIPAIEYLQYHGTQMEVIAFGETTSSRLKEIADDFTDLSENREHFLIREYKNRPRPSTATPTRSTTPSSSARPAPTRTPARPPARTRTPVRRRTVRR